MADRKHFPSILVVLQVSIGVMIGSTRTFKLNKFANFRLGKSI